MTTINKQYIVIATVLFVLTGAGLFVYLRQPKAEVSLTTPTPAVSASDVVEREVPSPPPDLDSALPSPEAKQLQDTSKVGVLLLGYGGAGHQGGFLSDVILLTYIDTIKKRVTFIHIPRDLWMTIPLTGVQSKINSALAMGTKTANYPTKDIPKDSVLRGAYLTKMAVAEVTGLPVNYVVGVDFANFARTIDGLGGVTVDVPQTFDDPWYPVKGRELELCGKTPEEVTELSSKLSGFELEKQFPCRYEQLHFSQGEAKMTGDTALKFVRSRHSNTHGGDFARGERQIAVVNGIKDKLFSLKALDDVPKFFNQLSKTIKSDIPIETVTKLVPSLKDLPTYKAVQVGLSTSNVLQNGTSKRGAYILTPKAGEENWSEVRQYIQQELSK